MGIFDLDEYEQRKKRADESARAPRPFPVVHSDVYFDGRLQTLRFEPFLLDGAHVFISFRPKSAPASKTLVVGKLVEKEKGVDTSEQIVQGLTFYTGEAFDSANWLTKAKENVRDGYFGRVRLEKVQLSPKSRRWDDTPVFQFFSNQGVVDEEDYIVQRDIITIDHHWGAEMDDDIIPDFAYWSSAKDAPRLLIDLDEDAFYKHLEEEQANPKSLYGLSVRWKNLSFEEKHQLLPAFEREIEAEVLSLMQALILSDPAFSRPNTLLQEERYWGATSFWRSPRVWINTRGDVGQLHFMAEQFKRRVERIWPHISQHFSDLRKSQPKEDVHPLVLSWMSCRGAYMVQFTPPNSHEHLEARLTLRNFLRAKNVSLDSIEMELKREAR